MAQGQTRHAMLPFGEFFRWRSAHFAGNQTDAHKLRKACFNRFKALAQSIILRVRDNRRVFLVVGDIVRSDLLAKLRMFRARFQRRQLFDVERLLRGRSHQVSDSINPPERPQSGAALLRAPPR